MAQANKQVLKILGEKLLLIVLNYFPAYNSNLESTIEAYLTWSNSCHLGHSISNVGDKAQWF